MASLPQGERQRLLETVWKSRTVLSAWNRYATRPMVLPLIPVVPIGIYGAIENFSTLRTLLIASPIIVIGILSLRRYYMLQFLSVFRAEFLARMPSNVASPKIGE